MHSKLSAFESNSTTEMLHYEQHSNEHHNHAGLRPSHLLWKGIGSKQVIKKNKKGCVGHHEITKLTMKDLQGLTDNATNTLSISRGISRSRETSGTILRMLANKIWKLQPLFSFQDMEVSS